MTNDLTTVTGANIFATLTVSQTNVPGNYILINGCSSYQDAQTIGIIFFDSVLNAGQVKTTNSFIFSFYAVSGGQTYPIA